MLCLAHGQELSERHVGQARRRDPDAELGHRARGPQQAEAVHRREHLRQQPADPAAEDLAHPLEPLRLLQPSQGQRSHHRPLSLPEALSQRYPGE